MHQQADYRYAVGHEVGRLNCPSQKPCIALAASPLIPLPLTILLSSLTLTLLSLLIIAGLPSTSAIAAHAIGGNANASTMQPQASPTATCPLAWRTVPVPDFPGEHSALGGVAGASPNDVWAVGGHGGSQTLIEHWDGSQWSIAPSPNCCSLQDASVIAGSADDVWAVGLTAGYENPATMHWDGSTWTVIQAPNLNMGGRLQGVAGASANDVWAVGWYYVPGIYSRTLIMHWDGSEWSIVPSPNVGEHNNELRDVAVISPNDVWAVGYCFNCYGPGYSTMTLHWDGQSWTVVPSPNNPDGDNQVREVAAVSTDDVWVVSENDLILHWDGSEWSIVEHPSLPGDTLLQAVTARPGVPDDVWAVGYNIYAPLGRTVALHWDGSEWRIVPSPNPGSRGNWFFGVFAIAEHDVWAVGQQWSGSYFTTLTERYSNECPSPSATPSLTPSSTPTLTSTLTPTTTATHTSTSTNTSVPAHTSTSTSTQTAAVPTATAPIPTLPIATTTVTIPTPTPCALQFTDVPQEHIFYANVRCLACRGIITGYSDGTFRPNSQVTRGQLAKIVSNAAGFAETPTQQTFEDVTPTNTFYVWIERLTTRGYMTGYACGGAGEPCVSGKPYFRPFANATRGQTSKIISNAAGFTETPTGQTFEDVPPTHTFYEFIQRLASRGVMGGYQCGGPGEPCLSGKPYFRPGNNVTRGQSSKIVANTFFPACNP